MSLTSWVTCLWAGWLGGEIALFILLFFFKELYKVAKKDQEKHAFKDDGNGSCEVCGKKEDHENHEVLSIPAGMSRAALVYLFEGK